MGLEAGTYINSLVATNPVGATDPKSQGDDHLRLIKSTILNTFPAITGAVTPTHTAINQTCVGTGGTFPAINGSALTALNGSAIASGTVADARLSANIPLLNAANLFTNNNTITVGDNAAGLTIAGVTGKVKIHGYHASFLGTFFQIRNAADSADAPLTFNSSTAAFSCSLGNFSIGGVASSDFARLSQANTFAAQTTFNTGAVAVAAIINSTAANGPYITFQRSGTPFGDIGCGKEMGAGFATDALAFAARGGFKVQFSANAVTTPHLSIETDGSIVTQNLVAGECGYKGLPQNSQSVDYTGVLTDAGKNLHQTGATKTFTIPANSSVAYPIGTALNFTVDNATGCSIAITTDTLRFLAATGTRTLAQYGVATAIKVAATTWLITGTGLS